jgi:hypothetical protein
MRIKSLLLLTLCWVGLAQPARAAIVYEFVTDQQNYTVNPGQTATVNIFLQETISGTSTSMIASLNGLYGAGFFVNQAGSSPTGAKPSPITAIAGNGTGSPPNNFDGFTTPTLYTNATTGAVTGASVVEQVNFNNNTGGPSGTTNGGSVSPDKTVTRVFVGTLTLAAGDASSTTTYTLQSYKYAPNGSSGNTLTFVNGYNLDLAAGDPSAPQQFTGTDAFGANGGPAPYTFGVAVAVPEPGSMGLASLAAAGMAVGAWRRWRNRRKARA